MTLVVRNAILSILLLGFLSACGPQLEPMDRPIDAASSSDYHSWLNRHEPSLPLPSRDAYQRAMDTLSLEIGVTQPGVDSAQRRARILQLIDTATPRQVIAYAEWIRLHRLALETAIDREMLVANHRQAAAVRLGSDKSIGQSIRGQIHAIEVRIRDREQDATAILTTLNTLMPDVAPDFWTPKITSTAALPAEVVLERCPRPQLLGQTSTP